MMKVSPTLFLATSAALLLFSASAQGTVTLLFGNTSTHASNWANSDGAGGELMRWGIIIDTAGDGFDTSYGPDGVSYVSSGTGQSLLDGEGNASDDLLFIAPPAMVVVSNTNDGAILGQNRITGIVSIPIGGVVNTGDAYRIVWFDQSQNGAAAVNGALWGHKYGTFGHPDLWLPPDGNTTPYFSVFTGADPLKQMTHTFVPEPAAGLLGLLGAGLLLRSRRRA